MKLVNTLSILGISIGMFLLLGMSSLSLQNVQATGGAEQISDMVMAKLNDALTYLNEGDTQAAQQEIQDAINELKDTYEADKEQNN